MRTPDEVMADYRQFRGMCKELAESAAAEDRSLTVVRGHYFCLVWARDEPHWWCKREDGTIVDPSARQFPSNGAGVYEEFDGIVECANCGKEMPEADARFDGRYAFCSTRCNMRFVGL